jgi:MGT family glycosyltransferase
MSREPAMASRGRFLFVSWDGGGNVPPALALGQRLVGAGHEVSFLASRSLQARAEAVGLTFRAFREVPEWGPHLRRQFEDSEYLGELWLGPAVGRDLTAQLKSEPADVLIVDFSLCGALAAAERSGLPTAALAHVLYHLNVVKGARYTEVWEECLSEINETRREFGLAPLASSGHTWDSAALVLALTPKEFDSRVAHIARNVQYVGPAFLDAPPALLELPWQSNHADPLVLITFSTTYQRQEPQLQRVIDAVADLSARGLVTAGPAIDAADLRIPSNVTVLPYLDHHVVLPSAAAVVTHGGLSTVMAALAHGVPLLCMPMGRDQNANAERVVVCRAGRVIDPQASTQMIRTALLDVIESPTFRAGARRMQKIIRRLGHGSRAVQLLEGLLPFANSSALGME